jgi:uncharacterized membrane protein YgcG
MKWLGYLLVTASLVFLYKGLLILGTGLFVVGGFFASKLSISFRSLGVLLMLVPAAYGYHHGFNITLIILMIAGFVLASLRSRQRRDYDQTDWGFDWDFSSGSSSGDGCSSDSNSSDGGGCDGGGGGGD